MATIINPRKVADSKNSRIAFHGHTSYIQTLSWYSLWHYNVQENILGIIWSPESNGSEASSAPGTTTASMLNTVTIVQMKVLKEILQNGSNSDQY